MVSREEALAAIAEAPTTVEFRAAALDPNATIYRSGGGLLYVVGSQRLVGALGHVRAEHVTALYEQRELSAELLADEAAYPRLRDLCQFERAVIQTRSGPWKPATAVEGLLIRRLTPNDSLEHVPAELRDELAVAPEPESVFAGFLDGVAVSFAYACASENLFDIAIETLADYQRRGIAAAVVSTMIDHYLAQGKQPVWGARVDNTPSLRLAAKLGFRTPAGTLYVAEEPFATEGPDAAPTSD